MIGIQGAFRVAPRLGSMICQNRSIVSGPPQVKIPTVEKIFLGATLAISICAIPAYVLVNLKHYSGKE